MSTKPLLLAAALLPIAPLAAAPIEILTADLDAVATGTVDAAALNAATTGGTWFLNTARSGSSYTIQDSSGDKALLLDDSDTAGNNDVQQFAGVNITTAPDLANGDVTWSFRTATSRTGDNKALRYEFGLGNTVAATIDWYNSGFVGLNLGESGINGGTATAFTFLNPWNPASAAVRDVSVTFSGTTVSVNFNGVTLTGTIQNGLTKIGRLRIYSIASAFDRRGLFLDDITVTQTQASNPIPPKINSFTSVGSGIWELTLTGTPGKTFEFRSSTTLTFNPGTLVENLTQGTPGTDPGTIGGTNNSRVTTDGSGNAKVRFALSGSPSDFVRAEEVP